MWKFIGTDRSVLKEFDFIRVTAFNIPRWEEADCPGGGALYINDNEDFFRITDVCSGDDTVYIPGHVCNDFNEGYNIFAYSELINLVAWEVNHNELS